MCQLFRPWRPRLKPRVSLPFTSYVLVARACAYWGTCLTGAATGQAERRPSKPYQLSSGHAHQVGEEPLRPHAVNPDAQEEEEQHFVLSEDLPAGQSESGPCSELVKYPVPAWRGCVTMNMSLGMLMILSHGISCMEPLR